MCTVCVIYRSILWSMDPDLSVANEVQQFVKCLDAAKTLVNTAVTFVDLQCLVV